MNVELKTERLLLRPLTLADAETAFTGWTGDAEAMRYVSWLPHRSIAETVEWLREIAWTQDTPRDNVIWGFVLNETGALFGSGGLVWEAEWELYQVGYNINKAYWGHEYTTEAMRAILAFAAETLGIRRVMGGHAKENAASGRVLERLGFVYHHDSMTPHVDGIRVFDSREYMLDLAAAGGNQNKGCPLDNPGARVYNGITRGR